MAPRLFTSTCFRDGSSILLTRLPPFVPKGVFYELLVFRVQSRGLSHHPRFLLVGVQVQGDLETFVFEQKVSLHHLEVFHSSAESFVDQCKVQARFGVSLLTSVEWLSCSNRLVRVSQVRGPSLAEREIQVSRLLPRFVLRVATNHQWGVSHSGSWSKHCVKDVFVHSVCLLPCLSRDMRRQPSQLRSCLQCQSGFTPSGDSWSSRATATFHGNRDSHKDPRKLAVLRSHTLPSEFRLSVFSSVHRWSTSGTDLVLFRVSFREPQLVLFRQPSLTASQMRGVLFACHAGPVPSW